MKAKQSNLLIKLFLIIALVIGITTTSSAQGVELGDAVVITAEVLAIDKNNRIVTLRGPNNNVKEFHVGEEARNFDQVKVGDHLKIQYYESVAIYIGKPGTQPETDAGMIEARSAKGEKPGIYAVGAIDVSASVVAIDKIKRTVTLKLPDGHAVTTEVDKSAKAFDSLMVGDTIHARLTKAIAISLEKP